MARRSIDPLTVACVRPYQLASPTTRRQLSWAAIVPEVNLWPVANPKPRAGRNVGRQKFTCQGASSNRDCYAFTSFMPEDASLPVGSILASRYQIRRELGRGGMGYVYLCRDLVLNERVALKLMPRSKFRSSSRTDAGTKKNRRRKKRHDDSWFFYEEARALAGLHHPTIVRARDYGALTDGSPYLVMDVAPGRSLHEWIYRARTEGLLPWPVVWTTIDQVLAGLAHAHARGVIHGDLKPSNILLDRTVQPPLVYILDLGLAWLTRDLVDHRLDGSREVAPTVRYGAGTPGWMAPEQIRMATPHIGPATDLYPLGCLIYTLLTGEEPYDGSNSELMEQHKKAPAPEIILPPEVPDGVGKIIERLMAKWPWQRYDFTGSARREWHWIKPEGSTPVRPAPSGAGLAGLSSSGGLVSDISTIPDEEPFQVAIRAVATPGLLGLRPSPMVARNSEREHLVSIVQEVCASPEPLHRFILLTGQAGVGKSRLAEWLCQEAYERAFMLPLRARYRKIQAPLDGVVGALVQHYRITKASRSTVEKVLMNCWDIDADDEEGKTWVAGAAAWLCRRASDPNEIGPSGKRFVMDRPELRWLVMRETLVRTARSNPLLLWLDDLHRAPADTFQRLARVHRNLPKLSIVLVGTMRSEDVVTDTTARARVELLLEEYGGERMEIEPLDIPQTHTLLRETLPLADKTAEVAAKRSKGNPLFALQLLHSWAIRGDLKLQGGVYTVTRAALEAPAKTTADLWEERLAALPSTLRPAALAAAALGGDIRRDVLRELLASLGLEAERAITAMKRAQLLLLSGTERLRWTHALLQEHLLGRLREQAEAPTVFRYAADALAYHPAATSGRIVRHRVTNLIRAGDLTNAAELLHEYVTKSWSQVRDASATLRDLGLLDERLSGDHLADHLRWRAEALRHQGELDQARREADSARRMFRDLGDEANQAHCLRLLGHVSSDLGASAQGRRLVTRALGLFRKLEHEVGQAQCEVLLGEIDYLLGEHARARGLLNQAGGRFQAVGDILGRAQCLIYQGLIEQGAGSPRRARELLAVARADLERIGYRLGVAQCDVALAHADHREGDFAGTHERTSATLKMFHLLENPRGEAACERLLAMNALDSGHPNTAEVHASAAAALYERLNDSWGKVESLLLLAQVALYRGDTAAAREALIRCEAFAVVESEPVQHRHLTLAWLSHAEGRHDEAVRALDEARRAFKDRSRSADHTPQLLRLFARSGWPEPGHSRIEQWLKTIPR